MASTFRAKRNGHCRKCSDPILTGQLINWSRRGMIRGAWHAWHDDPSLPHDTITIPPSNATENGYGNGNGNGYHANPNPFVNGEVSHPVTPSPSTPVISLAEIQRIDSRLDALKANDAALQTHIASIASELRSEIAEHIKPQTVTITVQDTQGAVIASTDKRQHRLFATLLKLITLRTNCYLWGEAGSGKSSAAREIARLLGLPFYYLGLQAQTVESKLMGYMDANGHYVASDFYRAYTGGGVFLLDELELGNGNLLGSLNGALANGKASFPNGIQERHADFVCIATGNTPALGATPTYSDRRALDGAVRDRFCFIEWNIDPEFERALTLEVNPNAGAWVKWVQDVRKAALRVSPRLIATQRASLEGAKLLANGFEYRTIADMYVFRGFDAASVASVLQACPLPK